MCEERRKLCIDFPNRTASFLLVEAGSEVNVRRVVDFQELGGAAVIVMPNPVLAEWCF